MIKAVIFDMYETLITHYDSPLYFSMHMAADAGIPVEEFQALWMPTDTERTIGQLSFEDAIRDILKKTNRYSDELLNNMITKRIAIKRDCFEHLHPEIIPMLTRLKEQGMKIGLISNCFSEEAIVIRESILFPYFDAVYLSYEQGVKKPNPEIFIRCMNELQVEEEECVFVGDGGSQELDASRVLGMKPLQAIWYFKEDSLHRIKPMDEYDQLKCPLEIFDFIFPEK